jgi:RecA-family ATPase
MSALNRIDDRFEICSAGVPSSGGLRAGPVLDRLPIERVLMQPCPEAKFVLPGLMPGMVGAIAGPGAAGKTMLQLQVAVDIALKRAPVGGLFPAASRALRVAFVSGEETEMTCGRRLHAIIDNLLEPLLPLDRPAARADMALQIDEHFDLYAASGIDVSLLRRGVRTPMLGDLRARLDGFDIVFFETLSRMHDGDENSATDMAALVNALEWLAQSTGAAVVVTHHTSKSAEFNNMSDSANAARGSSAFVDNIRWLANLFVMSKDAAAERGLEESARKSFLRFEITKANHMAPTPARWLTRRSGGVLAADPVFRSSTRGSARSSRRAHEYE